MALAEGADNTDGGEGRVLVTDTGESETGEDTIQAGTEAAVIVTDV